MNVCVLCDKEILEDQGSVTDAKRRDYHTSCLRAALSELDKWGIEMMRHFASTINLSIGAYR